MFRLVKDTALLTTSIMGIVGFIGYVLANIFGFDEGTMRAFYETHRIEFILAAVFLTISVSTYLAMLKTTNEMSNTLSNKIDQISKHALEGQIAAFYHRHVTDHRPLTDLDIREYHNLEARRKEIGLNSYNESRMQQALAAIQEQQNESKH